MGSINFQIYKMFAFLAAIILTVVASYQKIFSIFKNNIALNSFIMLVFFFGVVWIFYQVYRLKNEQKWLNAAEKGEDGILGNGKTKLLKPLEIVLSDSNFTGFIPPVTVRSVLVSIENRLDETRDVGKYLVGLLVFLGLLGTFWGLSQTIGAIAGVIGKLDISATSRMDEAFKTMKEGLYSPLAGMGTAFSCSMFGLAGSLFLGLFDLQYSKALARFYNTLEEKLAYITKQTAISDSATYSGPAYSQSLLEQTIEAMSALQLLMKRGEDNRLNLVQSIQAIHEKISTLTDQMISHQSIMKKIAQNHIDLQQNLEKSINMNDKLEKQNSIAQSLKSLDAAVNKLLSEAIEGRTRMLQELKDEIRLIARTLSALADGENTSAS